MGGTVGAVVVGLLTGAVGWTLAQLLLAPRLVWSTFISKWQDQAKLSGYSYRVKLKNASWFRSVAAMELHGRVRANDLDPRRPGTAVSLRFRTAPEDVKRLSPRAHTLVYLEVDEMTDRTLRRLSEWGHGELAEPERSLESLLELDGSAFCSVQVLAVDGWTGTMHYRESPHYRHGRDRSDISSSTFDPRKHRLDRFYASGRRRLQRLRRWWSRQSWMRWSHPELQPASGEHGPGHVEPAASVDGAPTEQRQPRR